MGGQGLQSDRQGRIPSGKTQIQGLPSSTAAVHKDLGARDMQQGAPGRPSLKQRPHLMG